MTTKSNSPVWSGDSVQPLVVVNKAYFKALKLYEKKNWRAARDAFQDFLSITDRNPLYLPAMYYLAYCYQELNDQAKSSTLYHKVIAQANEEEAFWVQMAQKRLEAMSPAVNTLN